jgi:hypothetical protein
MAPLGDKIVTAATAGGLRRGLSTTPATGAAVAVIALATALCWNAVALADDTPAPPPATTTVPDAPPPEPYQPPPRVAEPKKAVTAPRPAPASRTRTPAYSPPRRATYTPPVVSRPSVQSQARKPRSKPKAARKRQAQRTVAKQTPVNVTLAPLAEVLAAVQPTVIAEPEDSEPYLWLAGVSFAALAVAGSSLLRLTLRSTESGWTRQ